jgi:hypothetical protein
MGPDVRRINAATPRRVAYALDIHTRHEGRIPLVVLARGGARVGRVPAVPTDPLRIRQGNAPAGDGLGFRCLLGALDRGGRGVVSLRRRHVPVYPLLAPILTAAIGIALTFGSVRYRTPADVSIVLLAAVAIARVLRTGPGALDRGHGVSSAAATARIRIFASRKRTIFIVAMFVVSRCAYLLAGVRFNSHEIWYSFQILPRICSGITSWRVSTTSIHSHRASTCSWDWDSWRAAGTSGR